MQTHRLLRNAFLIGTALAPVLMASPALAQTDAPEPVYDNEIIVTATRRKETVQDVPINIAAVTDTQLQTLRAQDLAEIALTVPGVYIVDNGQRAGNTIVFRGLNANALGSNDGDNSGGGTVATYFGEIPMYMDFRANDMERVEFLIGPQGTLYGAGTLGGAIRYIPKRPQFDKIGGEIRQDYYNYSAGKGISTDTGMTINLPLTSNLAFRGSIDYLNDRGYIDQPYTLTQDQLGTVNPNDFANTKFTYLRDVNWVHTLSARAALRWKPVDTLDINLTYYYQDSKTGGRSASSYLLGQSSLLDSNGNSVSLPVSVGKYESLSRIAEPNQRTNQMVALETYLDLDFAELTSATGYSKFHDYGHRDQTNLLITLQYGYEAFPNFTSYTTEEDWEEAWTQELRLVSKGSGPFKWIFGGFYNHQIKSGYSKEYTPHLDEFYTSAYGGAPYPENLEYYSDGYARQTEWALYGELSYDIVPDWQVTLGGRYYNYKSQYAQATDLPLLAVAFYGRTAGEYVLDYDSYSQSDHGFLWKINSSYKLTPDAMVYATVSTGFRNGGRNPVNLCENTGGSQSVCAQSDELSYKADRTTNYEIGFKSQWFNRKVTLNGDAFYIDWKNPRLASATLVGLLPIYKSGAGARSRGFELTGAWQVTPEFSIHGNLAYVDAKLTATSSNLITVITPPGFSTSFIDGQDGDRLPGSPKWSGNLFLEYRHPIGPDMTIGATWKVHAQSDVLSVAGGNYGLTLPGYSTHGAALTFEYKGLSTQLYVDNLFDKYALAGVVKSPDYAQVVYNANGDPVYVRSFATYPIAPRVIGIRSTIEF